MTVLAACVAVAIALVPSAQGADVGARSAEKEPEGKILFDYRSARTSSPALSEVEQDRIVKAVTKAVEWEKTDEKVWINSAFSGSFSKRGARETAYMLQPGGPRAMEPHSMMDTVMAVFSGQRLVAAAQAAGWNFIKHVEDVDHDGVDELLLDGSFMTFGALMTSARLVRLKGDELSVVHDFDGVYEGACGREQDAGVRAGVLRYDTPGKDGKPTFRVDVYAAPCSKDGTAPRLDQYKYLPGEKITW